MFFNFLAVLCHVYLLEKIQPKSLLENILVSLICFVGFTASSQISPVIWENKSVEYFFINAGYRLTATLARSFLFYFI